MSGAVPRTTSLRREAAEEVVWFVEDGGEVVLCVGAGTTSSFCSSSTFFSGSFSGVVVLGASAFDRLKGFLIGEVFFSAGALGLSFSLVSSSVVLVSDVPVEFVRWRSWRHPRS
jgi:hypothetical protein